MFALDGGDTGCAVPRHRGAEAVVRVVGHHEGAVVDDVYGAAKLQVNPVNSQVQDDCQRWR